VPTAVLIRLTVAGLNSTPVAIPDNATVCGLVASLSKTLSVPAGKPTEVGAKFTRMSQVPPTMIFVFALQVVMPGLMVKGPITEVAGFFSVSVALVLLVKVILVGPLIDPTAVAANAIELGFKLTELVPVPDWLKGQMAIRSLNAPEHGGPTLPGLASTPGLSPGPARSQWQVPGFEDRGRSRAGGPRRPADEPSSGFEIPFLTISSSLFDEIWRIHLACAIPTERLFRQVRADFPGVRLDEGDGAFYRLAGLERGKVGQNVVDCLAAADCIGDAFERNARAGQAIAVAAGFDILTHRQIAHDCFQFTAPGERLHRGN
jgi:hypothetical protein